MPNHSYSPCSRCCYTPGNFNHLCGDDLFKNWCLKNKHLSNSKNTHLWEQLFYVHCQKIFGRTPNSPIEVFIPNVSEPSIRSTIRRKLREGEL